VSDTSETVSIAATVVLLALATLLIYGRGLDRSPVYLSHDEVIFSLNARSIAESGRDLNGRFLPVYAHVSGTYWQTPVVIYFTALLLKVLPLSEITIRIPPVIIGMIDVLLMYFVARRLFKRRWLPPVAAGLLLLTPAHFIHARLAVDHLYPLPFVLAWLWCLDNFLSTDRPAFLLAATAALGFGAYTYLAAEVMMPVFFALTCLAIVLTRPTELRLYGVATLGFLVPLVPLLLWFATHPTQYGDQVRMYSVYDASRLNPLQGLKDLLSSTSVTARTDVYWNYFNPSFLFFAGDAGLINGTRRAGVVLWPCALWLPPGLYDVATSWPRPTKAIVLLGFALSPIAAVLVGEPHRINRALVMLPFAALIAAAGIEWMWSARRVLWRAAAIVLLVAAPLQFASFYRDYFGEYRIRSSNWFERNIRGAVNEMMARSSAASPGIYLSTQIEWIDYYWRFYAIKSHREDLVPRAVTFDPKTVNLDAVPAGALLLDVVDGQLDRDAATHVHLRRLSVITEPNDVASFVLLERVPSPAP